MLQTEKGRGWRESCWDRNAYSKWHPLSPQHKVSQCRSVNLRSSRYWKRITLRQVFVSLSTLLQHSVHSNYKSYLSQIPHSSYQLSRISRSQILSLKVYITLKKERKEKIHGVSCSPESFPVSQIPCCLFSLPLH